MFNKQPKNITNHYHNVFRSTTEIDYEKLAKEMVKAQQEAEEQKKIERQKAEENEISKSPFIISLMCFSILVISIVLSTLIVICCIALILAFTNFTESRLWQDLSCLWQIIASVVLVLTIINILSLAIVILLAGIEIYKEKDRDFIMSAFSNMIGFVALIVALIALFQSNGATEIIPYLEEIKNLLIK